MSVKYIYKINDVSVIELEGRIDIHVADNIGGTISDLIDEGAKKIIVDLKHLKLLDSSGLRVFVGAKRMLDANNGDVKIVNMNKSIKKVFNVTGMDDMFEIYDNIDKAVNSFN
jgi:stage II sporulation protein AA (anti-sigma F factor antagonist)